MNELQFQARTRAIGLRVLRMAESLPTSYATSVIAKQVVRSATSIGANYRAACRAQSQRDMIKKLQYVEEEADETIYWLELLIDGGLVERSRLADLIDEVNQIVAMTVASQKMLRTTSRSQSRRRTSL